MTGVMIMEDINIQRHICAMKNIKVGCLKESTEGWLGDR